LASYVLADKGTVDYGDKNGWGGMFSNRLSGGLGWDKFEIKKNLTFTFTNADGTAGAIAWGAEFPRLIIGKFSSSDLSMKTLTSRTSYSFFGAASVKTALFLNGDTVSGAPQWTLNVQDGTYNNLNVLNVTYSKTFTVKSDGTALSPSISITQTNLILKQSGTIFVEKESFAANVGDVKSSYYVTGWPFTGTDTSMWLAVYVNSHGSGVRNATLAAVGATFGIGDGTLTAPLICTVDGQAGAVSATVILDDNGKDNGAEARELFVLTFPQFTNYLSYDPVNTLSTSAGSVAAVCLWLVALLALISIL